LKPAGKATRPQMQIASSSVRARTSVKPTGTPTVSLASPR
jgi:hypothetical protein